MGACVAPSAVDKGQRDDGDEDRRLEVRFPIIGPWARLESMEGGGAWPISSLR